MESILKELRTNARRRRIECTLTIDDLRALTAETGYLEGRGRHGDNLHIDRINPTIGYVAGNVQILTCSANVAKGNRERYLDEDKFKHRCPPMIEEPEDELYECPF